MNPSFPQIDTAFGALNIGGVAGIQGATTPGGSPAKFSTGSTALPPTSASLGAPGSGAGITSGVPSASMPNLQTMNRHLQGSVRMSSFCSQGNPAGS